MICKHISLTIFLNEPELIFYTQINGFKYCDITVTVQHQSFVCTQFVGNFIFQVVRTNLFAHQYCFCFCFYTIK